MNSTAPVHDFARTHPDAVAMIGYGGAALSYATLDRHIDRCARRARSLGLEARGIALGISLTVAGSCPARV